MKPEIKAKLDHLDTLREKQGALYGELGRSLAIKTLVPEAFAHGSARIRWRHTAKGLLGVLIDGNGTEYELPDDAAEVLGLEEGSLKRKR